MKTIAVLVLCGILVTPLQVKGLEEDDFVTKDSQSDDYDVKLSNFIQEILENFRDQMHEGIPDVGIPPVDPLHIPNIDEDIDQPIAKVTLQMRDLNITGLSKFQIEVLKADLEKGFANISFSLPELEANGSCYMNGKLISIFPIKSDGPFSIHVTEVHIKGYADLNVTTGEQTRIHMNDLQLHLTFGTLAIQFESLMGGGQWTQVLLRIITGLGRQLFLQFHQEAMQQLNTILLQMINKELDKGTLSELLDQIPLAVPKDDEVHMKTFGLH